MSYPAQVPRVLSEIEREIENFRSALHVPVTGSLSAFVRDSMSKLSDFGIWPSFVEAFGMLEEFEPSRDREDARIYIDSLGNLPAQLDGKRYSHNVVLGKHMILGDCATQELIIPPLSLTVVDYGDLIPTSDELHRILGRAQKGGKPMRLASFVCCFCPKWD